MTRFGSECTEQDLAALHQLLLDHDAVHVDHEVYLIVEERWPHLLEKLIPAHKKMH